MGKHESFGECLQRLLAAQGMSASEAARLVGFRSRNSIFRILNGDTSRDVDARFLTALRQAVGDDWPGGHWAALEEALSIKRLGLERFLSDQSFRRAMFESSEGRSFEAETASEEGEMVRLPLKTLLEKLCQGKNVSVVICGCIDRSLATLLAACCSEAGESGRLTVRHYIDSEGSAAVHNIMAMLPLMSKVWYNARLVEEKHCPEEIAAMYRTNVINLRVVGEDDCVTCHQLVQYDRSLFIHVAVGGLENGLMRVLDRCRFQLEPLKPLVRPGDGVMDFVSYTAQYEQLERDGMILSVKPDIHFNLIPAELLYQAIVEGFEQTGMVSGEGLTELIGALQTIHEARVSNMREKRRPTHIVYSLPTMERFMQTGVQTDHFFIQRAYTVTERRGIIGHLLTLLREDPFFNVYFLREELPELRYEMTFYEGKGVLMLDAYTGYDLHDDHSEALITLPQFMHSFQQFFMEELLGSMTMSRAESVAVLERLLHM